MEKIYIYIYQILPAFQKEDSGRVTRQSGKSANTFAKFGTYDFSQAAHYVEEVHQTVHRSLHVLHTFHPGCHS